MRLSFSYKREKKLVWLVKYWPRPVEQLLPLARVSSKCPSAIPIVVVSTSLDTVLWDVDTGKTFHLPISDCTPAERLGCVITDMPGRVRLYQATTGELRYQRIFADKDGYDELITAICPLSNGRLSVAVDGGNIRLWNPKTNVVTVLKGEDAIEEMQQIGTWLICCISSITL